MLIYDARPDTVIGRRRQTAWFYVQFVRLAGRSAVEVGCRTRLVMLQGRPAGWLGLDAADAGDLSERLASLAAGQRIT